MENLRVRVAQSSRASPIGRLRTVRSLNVLEWLVIVVTLISISLGTASSIYRFSTLPTDSPDIIFSLLVFINLGFSLFYLLHGIFQEQPFEMLTLGITILLLWILICVNYIADGIQFKLIRLIVSSVLTVPNILVVLLVGKDYLYTGNLIFKTVGGEIKFQRLCRLLFFAYSLLLFDLQATVSCLFLLLQMGLNDTRPLLFLIFGLIYVFTWTSIAYRAMRTENLRMTWVAGLSALLQPALVIGLLTQTVNEIAVEKKHTTLSVVIYIAGVSCLLGHFTFLAFLVLLSHNYGRGLRQRVYGTAGGVPSVGAGEVAEARPTDPLISRAEINYDAITPA